MYFRSSSTFSINYFCLNICVLLFFVAMYFSMLPTFCILLLELWWDAHLYTNAFVSAFHKISNRQMYWMPFDDNTDLAVYSNAFLFGYPRWWHRDWYYQVRQVAELTAENIGFLWNGCTHIWLCKVIYWDHYSYMWSCAYKPWCKPFTYYIDSGRQSFEMSRKSSEENRSTWEILIFDCIGRKT